MVKICILKAYECKDRDLNTGECLWNKEGVVVGSHIIHCGYAREKT